MGKTNGKPSRQGYKVGTILSLPCHVNQGPLPNERVIECQIRPDINIEGIVPPELTKDDNRVLAAVFEAAVGEHIKIFFNGEIFKPGNPVKVPLDWIRKYAKVERASNE
jgi:hypothetical protein